MIPVYQPWLTELEREYVSKAMDSGWISSRGDFITQFEAEFAAKFGFGYAVAVNNGTAATHLSYLVSGVKPGDKVVVPNITFVATANAAKYCNAEVVLCPVNDWLHMDVYALEKIIKKERNIKFVVITHLFGAPERELSQIIRLCQKYNITLIEDACEALGSFVKHEGKFCGHFSGKASAFSFFGNKIITTGEGGMVVTNDKSVYKEIQLLRGQGQTEVYYHPVIGYNYRMTNIQAAIGLAQLRRFDEIYAEKQRVHKRYISNFDDKFCPVYGKTWPENNWWMTRVGITATKQQFFTNAGIDTRKIFVPMNQLPPYLNDDTLYDMDNWYAGNSLIFPSYPELKDSEIDYICDKIKEVCGI